MNEHVGYYHLTITPGSGPHLFESNNERAFVLSYIQQTLSMRTIIESPLGYHSLAAQIDLLAFSLTRHSCQLVLFGLSVKSIGLLCSQIENELNEYRLSYSLPPIGFHHSIRKLTGPHMALQKSISLHSEHEDWENDRYSSIGFYLHDRRGDWMRLWRVSRLYDCEPSNYRALCENSLSRLKTYYVDGASSDTSLHAIST